MRYQSRKSSCGPAALANALEAIGVVRSEDELGVLSKQDVNGTSSVNLRKAAEATGVETVLVNEQRDEVAEWCINSHINAGHSGLLVVDNDEHWVAIIGRLNGTYIVADSADNDLLCFYDTKSLLDRWRNVHGKFSGFFLVKSK